MTDRWFEHIELPISIDQFETLPRNSAYKYEYYDGAAHLSARPKCYNALLDLNRPGAARRPPEPLDGLELRALTAGDWDDLVVLFARAFHNVQPFASLTGEHRLEAARGCLQRTRTGGDGAILAPACFTAWARNKSEPPDRIGAALVTLLTGREAADFQEFERAEGDEGDSHPPTPIPHLTWIFVDPWSVREGVGTTLLGAVTQAVRTLGHDRLASSFLLGNDASTLWHWRAGFRLMSYVGAFRLRQRFRKRLDPDSGPGSGPGQT